MIRSLFILYFASFASLHSIDNPIVDHSANYNMLADQPKNDKHYILQAIETNKEIEEHSEPTDMGWRDWEELYITYDLKIDNGLELKLTISRDVGENVLSKNSVGKTASIEELFNTFYLDPGDEIEFFPNPWGTEWRVDKGQKIRFTLIRNGVVVGNYEGWRA